MRRNFSRTMRMHELPKHRLRSPPTLQIETLMLVRRSMGASSEKIDRREAIGIDDLSGQKLGKIAFSQDLLLRVRLRTKFPGTRSGERSGHYAAFLRCFCGVSAVFRVDIVSIMRRLCDVYAIFRANLLRTTMSKFCAVRRLFSSISVMSRLCESTQKF